MKIIEQTGTAGLGYTLFAETQSDIDFLGCLETHRKMLAFEHLLEPKERPPKLVIGMQVCLGVDTIAQARDCFAQKIKADVSLGASAVKTLGGRIVIDVAPGGVAHARGEIFGKTDWVCSNKADKEMQRHLPHFYEEMRAQVNLGRRLNVDEGQVLRERFYSSSESLATA